MKLSLQPPSLAAAEQGLAAQCFSNQTWQTGGDGIHLSCPGNDRDAVRGLPFIAHHASQTWRHDYTEQSNCVSMELWSAEEKLKQTM